MLMLAFNPYQSLQYIGRQLQTKNKEAIWIYAELFLAASLFTEYIE